MTKKAKFDLVFYIDLAHKAVKLRKRTSNEQILNFQNNEIYAILKSSISSTFYHSLYQPLSGEYIEKQPQENKLTC